MEALKWFPRYLKGTSHVCLVFGQDANGVIEYCDSDYVGDWMIRNQVRIMF